MLIGLPRSGTTFLYDCIKQVNNQIDCSSEVFNTLFINEEIEKISNNIYLKNFVGGISDNYIEKIYSKIWKNKSENSFTKEVFLIFLMPFFIKKFDIFTIYRHRKYTFPTSRGKLFYFLYRSLLLVKSDDKIIQSIQQYLNKKNLTLEEQYCAIHTVANYYLLKYSFLFDLPIINYEKLMILSGVRLYNYLEKKIPRKLFSFELSELIEKKRYENEQFLLQRAERYQQLGVEPFVQDLLTFIKQLDPEMLYWYLFE